MIMRYTINYIYLIDFFLEKRDITTGGVDCLDTFFTFNKLELFKHGLNEREAIKILDVMKQERAWIIDGNGKEHEVTVVGSYIKKNKGGKEKIEVYKCSIEQLIQYKNRVIKKLDKSIIEVDSSNKQIRYGNNEWIPFSKAGRWPVFNCLYRNFPKSVSYLDIANELLGYKNSDSDNDSDILTCIEKIPETITVEKRIKDVQEIVGGLRRRMNNPKYGFPSDAIKTELDKKKYRLAI